MDKPDNFPPAMGEKAMAYLSAKYQAREKALQKSREVVHHSANAIRAVHRGEFSQGMALLGRARGLLDEIDQVLESHPDIYYAGFVQDAQKEYAEGWSTLALVAGSPLMVPEELKVGYAPYLNGLGEAVGELRRHVLDLIRKGELERCEKVLATMEDIYGLLTTLDFPEGVTGGLRRVTDGVRGILERTRGDLTMALSQAGLERKLKALSDRLEQPL